MTQDEFNNTNWYKGMICYSVSDTKCEWKLEVIGVDFECGIIVVKDPILDRTREHHHFSEIKLEKNKMNDIDYCVGTNCPLKRKCKRHLMSLFEISIGMTNWWVKPPYREKNKSCELFIKCNNETTKSKAMRLRNKFIKACDNYARVFCKKYELDNYFWMADRGEYLAVCDYVISFTNVMYMVDNDVPWSRFVDWSEYVDRIKKIDKSLSYPNLKNWCRGCPLKSEE